MNTVPGQSERKSAQIFLSYCRKDRDEIERLYHRLEGAGYKPWMDDKDILPGQDFERAIKKAVESSDFFIACLSSNSIDRRGDIQREIQIALKKNEERLAEDIHIIPVRLDDVEIPESIKRFQWVDLFAEDGFNRLRKSLEAQGFPGKDQPSPPPATRMSTVRSIRDHVFDRILPCYLLDDSYHFLDWNPAFDEIVARQLGLRRGDHAFDLIEKLANCREVIERSKEVFGAGKDPLLDIEMLHFPSDKHGLIVFQKLACQIPGSDGNARAWSVCLNILVAERFKEVFEDIEARLNRELNWSRYAQSYDRLLLKFDKYHELLRTVAGLVDGANVCIDLGAGTGNGTLELLHADPNRELWAVESNQDMVEAMLTKVRDFYGMSEAFDPMDSTLLNTLDRVTIVKEDVLRLDDLPQNYFDAAILVNVLYATDNRCRCLQQAWRLLKPGGIVALSTSHSETDIDRLFASMRSDFLRKSIFNDMQASFEAAFQSHHKMKHQILRNTKATIREYVESAGFRIQEWLDNEYEGAVVVVKAVKI